MKSVLTIIKFCKEKYRILVEKKYSTISGTLVYFFIMSVVPFSFWASLLFGDRLWGRIREILELRLLSSLFPVLDFLEENAALATGKVGIVLLVTSLYSSTNLFYHMRRSGELLYRCETYQKGWKLRLSALVLLFLVLLSAALLIAVGWLGYRFLTASFSPAWNYIALYLFLSLLAFALSLFINGYVCPYRYPLRSFLPGSAITWGLWGVATLGFGVYLHFADFTKLYGAVSTVVVFFLFLYLMMNCFVVGVIFNSERLKDQPKVLKRF